MAWQGAVQSHQKPSTLADYMHAIRYSMLDLKLIPDQFRTREICLVAVTRLSSFLEHVPNNLKTHDFYLDAVKVNAYVFLKIPTDMITEDLCIALVQGMNNLAEESFRLVPYRFKTRTVIMAALTNFNTETSVLQYVPPEIITEEMCHAAIRASSTAIRYIPSSMLTEEMCFDAIKINSRVVGLKSIPVHFRSQRVCTAAINEHGIAFIFLLIPPESLTEDMCLDLVAASHDLYMKVSSAALRKDTPRTVPDNGIPGTVVINILDLFPDRIKSQPGFYTRAVQRNVRVLDSLSPDLLTKEVLYSAIEGCSDALKHIPHHRITVDLCMHAMKIHPPADVYDHVPPDILTEEMCLMVVKNIPEMVLDMPNEMKTPRVCLAAYRNDNSSILRRFLPNLKRVLWYQPGRETEYSDTVRNEIIATHEELQWFLPEDIRIIIINFIITPNHV